MTTNLKLILAAALFAAPLPANAQSRQPTNFNDAVAACEREHRVCVAVVEALAESNGQITASQLRDIQCRAEEFTAQDASELPHCDTANWNPPFRPTAPPPGWDIGNSFAKDVCTERDELRSDAACHAAYLRQRNTALPGYPSGDVRCTIRYQRDETSWEYWADDCPNCP